MHNELFTEFPSSKPAIHVPNWALILLFIAYALPANIGHAPWRGDDALHIGVAFSMILDGTWLTPQIAGQPFFDWPPLTYWLGAVSGKLFGWLLPLHDAIRLTNVAMLAIMITCLRHVARDLYGRESASAAAMLALGSVGLLVHAHEMQPLITFSAALSGVFYGLVQMRQPSLRASLITGIATGACFLSAGLSGLAASLPLWLVLPLSEPMLRNQKFLKQMLIALIPAILLSAVWPLLLAIFSPDFLAAWWQSELGAIMPHASHLERSKDFANLVGWFTWPLWPLVLWSLWRRRGGLCAFGHAIPLSSVLLCFLMATSAGSMRPANLVPLLLPLIVIAAGELCRLRRGAANAFDWFGVITFSMLGVALWLAWLAMNFGWPGPMARNILRLLPGFHPSWTWYQLLIALTLSVAWLLALIKLPFFQLRGAVHWAIGITLTWGLATTLCFSWFDYNKNYEPVSAAIASAIKRQGTEGCVSSLDVGDSQRAALFYFDNLRIAPRATDCSLKLAYATGRNALPEAPAGWETAWQMERGSGRLGERFAIYRRSSN